MALPFDRAQLRQPVRSVSPMTVPHAGLPPGLRELAEVEQLPDAVVQQLASAYYTIRGRKPATLDEWRPIYAAIKPLL